MAALALALGSAKASTYTVLHTFSGGTSDGAKSFAPLVLDDSGFLYGTTISGGASNAGTVFKMKSDGSQYSVLHSFANSTSDGGLWSWVILDKSGNIFGTSIQGGAQGLGTVFTMKSDGSAYSILHSFSGGSTDGQYPTAPLVWDGSGALFGTTWGGGTGGVGTVFRIGIAGDGFTILHSFTGADGEQSRAAVVLDGQGYLYGTTTNGGFGGPNVYGNVFKMRTDGTAFSILHSFSGGEVPDGLSPGPLMLDSNGTLFGISGGASTTGTGFGGTVFSITTAGLGFVVLHSFYTSTGEGALPTGVVGDGFGKLYGTCQDFGSGGWGTVFSMTTFGDEVSVLHTFLGPPSDGGQPKAQMITDGSGNLYGTTGFGGQDDFGTVFKISGAIEPGGPLAAPVITSPTANLVSSTTRVSLKWNSVAAAGGYGLAVIDDTDGFVAYEGTSTSSTSVLVDLPVGGYTFGVRACSGGFSDANCGPFATVDFTVNVLPPTTSTTKFYTLTPCRVADTRNAAGPYGGPALQAGIARVFKLTGQCGIPTGAKAASGNVTVVTPTDPGELKLNPTGADPQVASAISFPAGRVLANNAMVFLGTDGAMSVFDAQDTGSTHFIIDVNGYFK